MGFMGRKSQLKSEVIKKVWLNRKDYKFLDYKFKVTNQHDLFSNRCFNVSVFNCEKLILKLEVNDKRGQNDDRFIFKVIYFNPQTDNDCFSINHIIGVCSEFTEKEHRHEDMGNAEIIKNQFILRRKKNYYSYVRVWCRGRIERNNFDKSLSYEFATDEYLKYIKSIFEIEKMQGRKIKDYFKDFLNKIILLEKLK